jgi:methionyl aminopeptidase
MFGKYAIIKPKRLELKIPLKSLFPRSIQTPDYFRTGIPSEITHIPIYKDKALDRIKSVNALTRDVLEWICEQVKPGISTAQLNKMAFNKIIANNAYPSPLYYHSYPASICTSVNNVICHGTLVIIIIGVPDERILQDGDIINIDVSLFKNGFHGDSSKTVLVGEVDEFGQDLVDKTRQALKLAIAACGPQVPFGEIGCTIQEYVDINSCYSISHDFCGHGIGETFHQAPLIEHFANDNDNIMLPGMVFTIGKKFCLIKEPILTQGTSEFIKAPDDWTIFTKDDGRAAQFEHTILITENGPYVLTA